MHAGFLGDFAQDRLDRVLISLDVPAGVESAAELAVLDQQYVVEIVGDDDPGGGEMADHWLVSLLAAAWTAWAMHRNAAASRPGWTGIWKVAAISASAWAHGLAHRANPATTCADARLARDGELARVFAAGCEALQAGGGGQAAEYRDWGEGFAVPGADPGSP